MNLIAQAKNLSYAEYRLDRFQNIYLLFLFAWFVHYDGQKQEYFREVKSHKIIFTIDFIGFDEGVDMSSGNSSRKDGVLTDCRKLNLLLSI